MMRSGEERSPDPDAIREAARHFVRAESFRRVRELAAVEAVAEDKLLETIRAKIPEFDRLSDNPAAFALRVWKEAYTDTVESRNADLVDALVHLKKEFPVSLRQSVRDAIDAEFLTYWTPLQDR